MRYATHSAFRMALADHATALLEHAPAGRGPYYLGVRETPGRYSAAYGVIDSTGLGAEDE